MAAPDLPLSEPDHPGSKRPGAAGERDLTHPKHPRGETARSRTAQRSLHRVPALLGQRGNKCRDGRSGWLSCLQEALHTQSGTCASALRGHTL